jgi:hypothetical protein
MDKEWADFLDPQRMMEYCFGCGLIHTLGPIASTDPHIVAIWCFGFGFATPLGRKSIFLGGGEGGIGNEWTSSGKQKGEANGREESTAPEGI